MCLRQREVVSAAFKSTHRRMNAEKAIPLMLVAVCFWNASHIARLIDDSR